MGITAASIREAHAAVAQCGGNKTAAAALIGLTRASLRRRLELSLPEKPRFRVQARRDGSEAPHFADAPEPRPEPLYSPDAPHSPASSETIRVLAMGDAHDDPYLSKERFRWMGRYAAEMQPDRIVQIGDICDLESLSFHSANDTESGRYKPRFMADMESLDQALEKMFEPMAQGNVTARFDLTCGNHEHRIWRFEDSAPEVSGMLQADFAAKMAKHNIAWHKYGKYLDIGGVKFTHAPFSVMGRPIGGATAVQTIARQSVYDMVSGHSHKKQVITSPKLGDDHRVTVIDLGCSLPWGHVQSYAKHTTTGWWHGVFMLTIKDGRIQGHEAVPMFELQRRFA